MIEIMDVGYLLATAILWEIATSLICVSLPNSSYFAIAPHAYIQHMCASVCARTHACTHTHTHTHTHAHKHTQKWSYKSIDLMSFHCVSFYFTCNDIYTIQYFLP